MSSTGQKRGSESGRSALKQKSSTAANADSGSRRGQLLKVKASEKGEADRCWPGNRRVGNLCLIGHLLKPHSTSRALHVANVLARADYLCLLATRRARDVGPERFRGRLFLLGHIKPPFSTVIALDLVSDAVKEVGIGSTDSHVVAPAVGSFCLYRVHRLLVLRSVHDRLELLPPGRILCTPTGSHALAMA